MRAIWKFTIENPGLGKLTVPKSFQFLSVAEQDGVIAVWGLVDPADKDDTVDLEVRVVATGEGLADEHVVKPWRFLGTCQLSRSPNLVFHLFVKGFVGGPTNLLVV